MIILHHMLYWRRAFNLKASVQIKSENTDLKKTKEPFNEQKKQTFFLKWLLNGGIYWESNDN